MKNNERISSTIDRTAQKRAKVLGLFCLFTLTLIWSTLPAISMGDEEKSHDGFEYVEENGKTILTQYTGNDSEITIPEGVTAIEEMAFGNHSKITAVTLSAGVKEINSNPFSNCLQLQKIEVDEKNENFKSVDGILFSKDGTKLVLFPPARTGEYTIPEGVTSIEKTAFAGCEKLTSVTIPEGVTTLEPGAFLHCSNIKEIQIPASVQTIEDFSFSGCVNLEKVEVAEKNEYFKSVNNVIFSKDGKKLLFFPNKDTEVYTIPEGVTSIGSGAFSFCAHLTSVVIPKGLRPLRNSRFMVAKV